jgi:N-acetylglutamate synthase-like GNAT family acetyltransferase
LSITEDILPANPVTVRYASAEDEAALLGLVGTLGHAVPLDSSVFSDSLARALADFPRTLIHVAEVDGQVAGYSLTTISTLLYTNGASAQLQEIAVDDSLQTRGVGTALVRAVEADCQKHGVTQLTVASRRAGGFYDRLGYTQQAEYMRRLF